MPSWMVVTNEDNFARTRELGFTIQGVKAKHRKRAERIAPGDRLCWYVTRIQGFAATATVTSPAFEDTKAIWVSEGAADPYPWRFRIEPAHVRETRAAVPATELAADLEFVRRWPAAHWRLAFQGNLHELPDADFERIDAAVARAGR